MDLKDRVYGVEYKVLGCDPVKLENLMWDGIHPDYTIPIRYFSLADGSVIEVPLFSLEYVKFDKRKASVLEYLKTVKP